MKRWIGGLSVVLATLGCENGSPPTAPEAVAATPSVTPPTPSSGPPPANRPPTAEIYDWQPRTTVVVGGTRVGFGARGTDPDGDPLKFTWDFDDGTTDEGEALHHVFHEPGTFRVTLNVSDGRGGEAEAQVEIRARSVAGQWSVVNALHMPLEATIRQFPNSSFIQGTMSDRSTFEGHLLDPYGIRIEYSTADDRCIASGVYQGTVINDVRQLYFQGPGCRDIRFLR